ncbi:MAG: hemerythrin domain-containing protein [Phycisphaerae bacterium]
MGTERMSPGEVAKWMRDEHQALIDLNKVLRQHIAARPEINLADWLRGLKVALERLRMHLERHFAAKEEDGYLSAVVEQRPTLSTQVEHIRREHDEILQLAEHILRDLSEVLPENRLLLADICARVQRFMAVVADHDQREIMITMYVFSQDIGTEG